VKLWLVAFACAVANVVLWKLGAPEIFYVPFICIGGLALLSAPQWWSK